MAVSLNQILTSDYYPLELLRYEAEPIRRLPSIKPITGQPNGRTSPVLYRDLKKSSSTTTSLTRDTSSSTTGILISDTSSYHSCIDFFTADTETEGEKKLSLQEIKCLWTPIIIEDNSEPVTTQKKEENKIWTIDFTNEERKSTNPLEQLVDQDRPTPAATEPKESLPNARHFNKIIANTIQLGSARINPQATQANETKPVDVSANSGLGVSFAGGLEAIFGLWGALKGRSEAKKKIKEIKATSIRPLTELEHINYSKTKKTAQRDIKVNTAVATRYSFSGMLNILRIGNYSAQLQGISSNALTKLGTAISFIAVPLAAFAMLITAYSIHKERKSISKSNQINDAAKKLQQMMTEQKKQSSNSTNGGQKIEEEISAILHCIRSKQNIKTKKASLLTNISSLGGYLMGATGGSLMLAYTVGGIATVATAAAVLTPIGWGLAALGACAGIGLAIHKYAQWRNHTIKKQNAAGNELLKISGAAAIVRLLKMLQDSDLIVQNAARSVLSQFMSKKEVGLLSTNDESFKFTARRLNIPVRIKNKKTEITRISPIEQIKV